MRCIAIILSVCSLAALTGCQLDASLRPSGGKTPPGHDASGPGNSEHAPGHRKKQ